MKIKGSCLCGEIKYEVAGELSNVTHCHCSMCRKAHGAAFATFATVEPDKFQWISGTDLVTKYVSSPELERYFCRKCGASLAAAENGKITDITLGTIELIACHSMMNIHQKMEIIRCLQDEIWYMAS